MNVKLLMTGQTGESYLQEGIAEYEKRIRHYVSFTSETIQVPRRVKSLSPSRMKGVEADMVLKRLNPDDHVILLDERGKQYTSIDFSDLLNKKLNTSIKNLVFVIGGPFGFDDRLYERADGLLSLSVMTFPHQLVRLIFLEQLYRALTIMRGEPYHHG
jgi:23S rRNA (pseudouridine1915-N3)-methyltransferase